MIVFQWFNWCDILKDLKEFLKCSEKCWFLGWLATVTHQEPEVGIRVRPFSLIHSSHLCLVSHSPWSSSLSNLPDCFLSSRLGLHLPHWAVKVLTQPQIVKLLLFLLSYSKHGRNPSLLWDHSLFAMRCLHATADYILDICLWSLIYYMTFVSIVKWGGRKSVSHVWEKVFHAHILSTIGKQPGQDLTRNYRTQLAVWQWQQGNARHWPQYKAHHVLQVKQTTGTFVLKAIYPSKLYKTSAQHF